MSTMEERVRRHWPPVYGDPRQGGHSLWLKGPEAEMMMDGSLTVIIRLGDRGSEAKTPLQYLHMFEPVACHVIDIPGDQSKGLAPVFKPDTGKQVMLVRRLVTNFGNLMDGDLRFNNGRAVPDSVKDVPAYILTDLAPGTIVTPETVITVYHIVHLNDAEPATA